MFSLTVFELIHLCNYTTKFLILFKILDNFDSLKALATQSGDKRK